MPIFFEKRSRGEDSSVLAIYGTKEDYAQLANDLKERLALQEIYREPESNLRIPNLSSSSFGDVEILVVSEEDAVDLQRSARRKKAMILAVWLLIVIAVVCALLFTPEKG
jgi:hypothetical protein